MNTGNLNCRPGDLAWVAGVSPACREITDRIVKLKNQPAFIGFYGEPCWELEELLVFKVSRNTTHQVTGEFFNSGERVMLSSIEDKYLRPIRGGDTPEQLADAIRDLYSIPSEVSTC